MTLNFLPVEILSALSHINMNFVTEIRLRKGLPVIIGYLGEYYYLDRFGKTSERDNAIICTDPGQIINAATGGSIYSYAEQIKNGFITCGHGVRIGLAGECVTQNGGINTVTNVTSLNIRIPHDIKGCAETICSNLLSGEPNSILIFSKPGLGKTTMLRDIARYLGNRKRLNVLVFDERNEISAMDINGNGFDLGDRADVIRGGTKKTAFETAVRVMRPDVIITDELYGEEDEKAIKFVSDCGIKVIASSHITDKTLLARLPFDFYAGLITLSGQPVLYDKNFNPVCADSPYHLDRRISVGQ